MQPTIEHENETLYRENQPARLAMSAATAKEQNLSSLIVPSLISAALLFVAASFLWVACTTYVAGVKSLGYQKVDGKIQEVTTRSTPFYSERAATVEFIVDGQVQRGTGTIPQDRLMKVSETIDVYYDKAAPHQVALKQEVDYDTVIIYGAFGLFALSIGGFMAWRLTRQ
jgi:hypothetical protein